MENRIINAWTAQKAGMDMIDKEAISKKVEEATRGTVKSVYEQELQRKREMEIAKMQQQIVQYRQARDSTIKQYAVKRIQAIQMRRDLSRVWAHFDFDMFYVACELLDHPEDIDKPCAVGTPEGVLCTANYVARQFGVRSALPTFIATKLCPDLILYKPDFNKYKKFSNILRTIVQQYDQFYQSLGLDEVYVDITDSVHGKSHEQVQEFIKEIRTRVFEKSGLTVSCGIGANRQLSKMASEEKKPNDQFIIRGDKQVIMSYLAAKPIRKFPGIGPVNEHYLKGLGVNTGKEVLQRIDQISVVFSDNTVQSLIQCVLGIDRNFHSHKEKKSIGRSETFKPTDNPVDIDNKLNELAEAVSNDLNESNNLTIHLAIGYQTYKYEKKEKNRKLDQYTKDKAKILKVAREVIMQANILEKIRLLGIRCTQLIDETEFKSNSLEAFITKFSKESEVARQPAPFLIQDQDQNNLATQTQSQKTQRMDTRQQQALQIRSSRIEQNYVPCPICGQTVQTKGNNVVLNKHIDRCLQLGAEQDVEQPKVVVSKKAVVEKQPSSDKKSKKKNTKGQPKKESVLNFTKKN